MNKPEQKFPLNTRVKLRDGVDPGLYGGFSRSGNEGWIRKRKLDRYGYPQVFLQWDKDHWAYNGQEDCWTWEGQFDAVEENCMADDANIEENIRAITENFVKTIFSTLGQSQGASIQEGQQADPQDEEQQWEELVAQAQDVIGKVPAYLLVVLEPTESPNEPSMLIPRVFHAAKDTDHALIVQSQLAHVVASFQDSTIARIIESKKRGASSEEG